MATAPHSFAALPELSPAVAGWVEAGSTADHPRSGAVVRRIAGRSSRASSRGSKRPASSSSSIRAPSRAATSPIASVGRGARRAPDLHLHQEPRRRRS